MMNPGSPATSVGQIAGITNTVAVFFSPSNPSVSASFSAASLQTVLTDGSRVLHDSPNQAVRVLVAGSTAGASLTINAITPGTGATNLGKAEDAAHTSGDVGVMALGVRNDTGAVLAGSDGDYLPFTTDATGALRTDLNGTVSTNNSSTATLTANSVFTGTSDDVLNYNEIRVSLIASHASATDGLSIQQSSDNSNWDITDTYTIPAATGKTYSVPRQARYFRVVYTNGGTGQTSFRLQTILNRLGSQASSQRPNDGYTNETDLEQNQVFLMGFNGATWDRMRMGTGVATGAQRVVLASDSAGSMSISGQTATLAVYFDQSAPTVKAVPSTGTFTVAFDPGHELGTIKGNSNTLTVFLPDTGHTIGKVDAGAGTFTVKFDPGNTLGKVDQGVGGTSAWLANIQGTASLFTVSGSTSGISVSGVTLISPSANASFKVYAYSLQTTGAVSITAKFTNGAGSGPTEFWRPLITAAGVTGSQGANLATQPGAPLFATGTSTTLALVLDTASLVHYSVSYTKESA